MAMSRKRDDPDSFYSQPPSSSPREELAYKRKRTVLRLPGADEQSQQHLRGLSSPHTRASATPGGSIHYDDTNSDEDDDDDEVTSALLQRKGWPTRVQIQR